MKDLWAVLDEKASTEKFITLEEVVNDYYGKKIPRSYSTSESNRMKTFLNRNKDAIEYKNGRSLDGGFRYKKGFEYFHQQLDEEKSLSRMNEDSKKLFLTGGLQMLFDGNTSMNHLIELECVSELQNLCLVKVLAKHIGKRVISFQYQQGYENLMEITMHPHLLKEYNSRWFLFGYVIENELPKVVNFSLDRIVYRKESDIHVHRQQEFIRVPQNFYQEYFKDIVGVTRPEGENVQTIIIRTTDFKVHHLLLTKPIHSSQKETVPFDINNKEGEFAITVIPNIELQTRLLSYGPGIYVTGDSSFLQQLKDAVAKMEVLYDKVKSHRVITDA